MMKCDEIYRIEIGDNRYILLFDKLPSKDDILLAIRDQVENPKYPPIETILGIPNFGVGGLEMSLASYLGNDVRSGRYRVFRTDFYRSGS